jgi:hypothetical protein
MARTVLKWSAGMIEFDAVTLEAPEHSVRITEYPVDVSADVVDHIRLEPARVRLRVIVSNDPARGADSLTHLDGLSEGRGVDVTVTEPLIPGADRAGLPQSVAGLPLQYETSVRVAVRTWSGKVQRVQNVYSELRNALAEGRLFTIASDIGDFDDMVLEKILPERDSKRGRSLAIDLHFRELFSAFLEQRDTPITANPVNERSKPPRDSGRQQATPADEQTKSNSTLLHRLLIGDDIGTTTRPVD